MHILLVADGRSPTTRRWVRAVTALGHTVTLITTFPCAPVPGVEADVCLPVAFSALAGGGAGREAASPPTARPGGIKRVVAAFRPLFMAGRYRLGPLTLNYYGPRLRWLVERLQPDLVHALRIPFEGMLAAWTPPGVPLAVSIWGNDLTLHAAGSARMGQLTRAVLARADALVADTRRDIRLGRAWGFADDKPTLVTPGSGGLDLDELAAIKAESSGPEPGYGIPADVPLVINPRGFRTGSVRQDTFFAAVPLIDERLDRLGLPRPAFVCPAMAGQREALRLVEQFGLAGRVTLLPQLPQTALWHLMARAAVTISVSQHDGTPNSLLEALALGVFPVAGDIESLREWITPGVNGLLVEPDRPQALADAVALALSSPDLRRRAAAINQRIAAERAAAPAVGEQIAALYAALAEKQTAAAG